jgi:hypothetical protein
LATAKKVESVIQRSATIGVEDTTIEKIVAAQKAVGAPDTARVSTGGFFPSPDNTDPNQGQPFSVTFTWTE